MRRVGRGHFLDSLNVHSWQQRLKRRALAQSFGRPDPWPASTPYPQGGADDLGTREVRTVCGLIPLALRDRLVHGVPSSPLHTPSGGLTRRRRPARRPVVAESHGRQLRRRAVAGSRPTRRFEDGIESLDGSEGP